MGVATVVLVETAAYRKSMAKQMSESAKLRRMVAPTVPEPDRVTVIQKATSTVQFRAIACDLQGLS
jgi:hypothetical protein